jgi:hypothetical protein
MMLMDKAIDVPIAGDNFKLVFTKEKSHNSKQVFCGSLPSNPPNFIKLL